MSCDPSYLCVCHSFGSFRGDKTTNMIGKYMLKGNSTMENKAANRVHGSGVDVKIGKQWLACRYAVDKL